MSTVNLRTDVKMVPFNQIEVDESKNSRHTLTDLDELANDIKRRGLIEPLVVKNGGDGKHPYKLHAGYRRAAALKLLKFGANLVPVSIRDADVDDRMDNLMENLQRVDLHPLDQAEAIHDMAKGVNGYKKYDTKMLAAELGKSVSHIENMVRVKAKLHPEVWDAVRASKFTTSMRLLFAWCALDEKEQKKAFTKWEALEEKLQAEGKRGRARGGEGDGEGEGGKSKSKKGPALSKKQMKEYVEILSWKAETVKGVTEKARYEGALDIVNFLFGEAKKTQLVTAADFKEYAKAVEAAAESEDDAEGEE